MPGLEATLSSAREEGKGVEEDGSGGIDPAIGDVGEPDVLDGGEASEGFLLESRVFKTVERDNEGEGGHGIGVGRQ